TINELCEKANYPRATFYNYFDDINDLLNYCWPRIARAVEARPVFRQRKPPTLAASALIAAPESTAPHHLPKTPFA
ncbi:hypothetical protein Q604_UNBC11238G0001, partial [human gut metagenome]